MWHRVESLLEVFLVVVAEEVAVFGDEVRGVAKTSWWSWGESTHRKLSGMSARAVFARGFRAQR
jgi:hypothetical protein|tara:strand:- start:80 stop:271 length:192 start_codon:yes stop_codon:yes gene_type:complete